MRRKSKSAKKPQLRRPLYFVDNPNKMELKWLDDIKKPNAKPMAVHGLELAAEPKPKLQTSAAAAEADRVQRAVLGVSQPSEAYAGGLLDEIIAVARATDRLASDAVQGIAEQTQQQNEEDAPTGFTKYAPESADAGYQAPKLEDGSITSEKLAPGSVRSEHVAPGAIGEDRLSFLPLAGAVPKASLLFGSEPYALDAQEKTIELTLTFEQPFANASYVLMAASDHPSGRCRVVAKRPEAAVLEVGRARLPAEQQGTIQWIAVGVK